MQKPKGTKFEKSKKDKEPKSFKEGSRLERKLDKKQKGKY